VPRIVHVFVAVGFLATIGSAALIQTIAELHQGQSLSALEVFRQTPSVENLRTYERNLEETSVVAKCVRPWAHYARFCLLADAGEKALVGRDGWFFYRPGVDYLVQQSTAPRATESQNPLPAITSFRDQLAARGIRLLVLPVPNKESVYPEMLSNRAKDAGVVVCRQTSELLEQLRTEGIEVIDLFEDFRCAKQKQHPSDPRPLYLAQDSHWSPEGMERAVQAVTRRIIDRGWAMARSTEYDERHIQVRRLGDVLQMLQTPQIERIVEPESITCAQVVQRGTGKLYQDVPTAQILVLGDSFLRIYEQDEPRSAGFIAHLARELRQPLASIVSDGGASTLVRQDLCRRSGLLKGKKLVIWEFVERDIRYGAEGWQVITLPAAAGVPTIAPNGPNSLVKRSRL
jgi:hypothetical protein